MSTELLQTANDAAVAKLKTLNLAAMTIEELAITWEETEDATLKASAATELGRRVTEGSRTDALNVLQETNDILGEPSAGVKRYTASVTQASTAAPVPTVILNTLSAAIVWTRTGAGVFVGTLASAFTANKTVITVQDARAAATVLRHYSVTRTSANAITLQVFDFEEAAADDFTAFIKIEVYP
jgi:hypothetical protein